MATPLYDYYTGKLITDDPSKHWAYNPMTGYINAPDNLFIAKRDEFPFVPVSPVSSKTSSTNTLTQGATTTTTTAAATTSQASTSTSTSTSSSTVPYMSVPASSGSYTVIKPSSSSYDSLLKDIASELKKETPMPAATVTPVATSGVTQPTGGLNLMNILIILAVLAVGIYLYYKDKK